MLITDIVRRVRRGRPLLADIISTSLVLSMGKGAGFLVPFFIAAWFGAGVETDVFFLVYTLVLIVNHVFSTVIENVIVPFISQKKARGQELGEFIGPVVSRGLAVVGCLYALMLLVLGPVAGSLTGFTAGQVQLLYRLLLEISPMILAAFGASVLSGVYFANHRFLLVSISPMLRAAVTLVIIYRLRFRLGIHAVALGYLCGELLRLLMLAIPLKSLGIRGWRFFTRMDREVKDFFKAISFQVVATASFSLNTSVDRIMAAPLGTGQISLLHYAERLYYIPSVFIVGGIMVPLLSHWSTRYSTHGRERLQADVAKAVRWLAAWSMLLTVAAVLLRQPLVRLVFFHNRIGAADLSTTAAIFGGYMVALIPHTIAALYIRAHWILRRNRRVMVLALATVPLNIVLNRILMVPLGTPGIALATAFSMLFQAVFLHFSFRNLVLNHAEKRLPDDDR